MKKWIILWASVLLAVALIVTLCLIFDRTDSPVDSDGDGRPDVVDEEVDDNLNNDNESKVDDFFNK